MPDLKWLETFTSKCLSILSRREVKTPLSFFFKAILALTVITFAALYLCTPENRLTVFLVAIGVLVLLCLSVLLFAWVNPKHLVYGETGHRAEWKLAMGTEKRELGEAEVATLPATTNTASRTLVTSTPEGGQ